jgi:uncharacterized protein YndB with AHSA1/START domain
MSEEAMNLQVEIQIEATPTRVFAALTKGVAVWWGKPYFESEDAHDIILEPKLGGHFFERWSRDAHSPDGALLGIVVAVKHPNLLRMRGSFGMGNRLVQGLVEFEMLHSETGTDLRFSHQASGDISEELKMQYARAWHDLLGRLKFYVEEGHGEGIRHEPHMKHM